MTSQHELLRRLEEKRQELEALRHEHETQRLRQLAQQETTRHEMETIQLELAAATPAAIDWTLLDEVPARTAALDQLAIWMKTKLIPLYLDEEHLDGIQTCWQRHPVAVMELSQLHQEWLRIFDRDKPLLEAAAQFTGLKLPSAMSRITACWQNCEHADESPAGS
ncbi:MAG TPA: hypothetical protein VMK13_13520 [Streptosporangiaceae bacterium]|nr:hypothetical protein [Streptosporangiaceae bacterium]